jgi:glycosyltransferase involved in cell wall biosynthesis
MSRILFLSRWFPDPPDNGSKVRILSLLQGLAPHHELTLISFSTRPSMDSCPALQDLCREIRLVPWNPSASGKRPALLTWLSLTPRSLVETHSAEMERFLSHTLAERRYDLVIASQLGTAMYAPQFLTVPALFEEAEVGFLYQQYAGARSALPRLRYGMTWQKHRRYIGRLLRSFRACTVVSEQERILLRKCAPRYNQSEVIPNCVSVSSYEPFHVPASQNMLIFAGSLRYFANHDAMAWFLGEVFPLIRSKLPEVRLTITGDHADLPLPQAQGVILRGRVEDVRPLIASSCVGLAPIRLGGGTRLKILEAMALRTPIVSTSKGAEGLEARHEEHLLIADSAEDFAHAVIRLLTDTRLRERLAASAHQLVRDRFDWSVVMPRFLNLVERIIRS